MLACEGLLKMPKVLNNITIPAEKNKQTVETNTEIQMVSTTFPSHYYYWSLMVSTRHKITQITHTTKKYTRKF